MSRRWHSRDRRRPKAVAKNRYRAEGLAELKRRLPPFLDDPRKRPRREGMLYTPAQLQTLAHGTPDEAWHAIETMPAIALAHYERHTPDARPEILHHLWRQTVARDLSDAQSSELSFTLSCILADGTWPMFPGQAARLYQDVILVSTAWARALPDAPPRVWTTDGDLCIAMYDIVVAFEQDVQPPVMGPIQVDSFLNVMGTHSTDGNLIVLAYRHYLMEWDGDSQGPPSPEVPARESDSDEWWGLDRRVVDGDEGRSGRRLNMMWAGLHGSITLATLRASRQWRRNLTGQSRPVVDRALVEQREGIAHSAMTPEILFSDSNGDVGMATRIYMIGNREPDQQWSARFWLLATQLSKPVLTRALGIRADGPLGELWAADALPRPADPTQAIHWDSTYVAAGAHLRGEEQYHFAKVCI